MISLSRSVWQTDEEMRAGTVFSESRSSQQTAVATPEKRAGVGLIQRTTRSLRSYRGGGTRVIGRNPQMDGQIIRSPNAECVNEPNDLPYPLVREDSCGVSRGSPQVSSYLETCVIACPENPGAQASGLKTGR